MPSVAFTTLGCKVNQYDTEAMAGLFERSGFEQVDFSAKADVYVINTCSVTHLGEKKSRQLIRRAQRTNPEAVIAVTGCYAQTGCDELLSIPGVSVVVGNQERHKIVQLVNEAAAKGRPVSVVSDIMHVSEFEDIPLQTVPSRTRAFLKIQEGCTNFCTYCIIPYARGPLRSREPDSVEKEARKLVQQGFKEIVLTGIHLGAYGRDLAGKWDITAICQRLAAVEGLARLRLSSIEITEVNLELAKLLQNSDIMCRHLHLPLQCGDDEVLRRMNRRYTATEFVDHCTSLAGLIPGLAITTDLIVGFPGETDEEFENSKKTLAKLPLAKIHVFPYSRRKGTPAADMPGQVPKTVKEARVKEILEISAHKEQKYAEGFLGKTMPVLFETWHDGVLEGLTDNYLHVKVNGSDDITGRIAHVELLGASDGIISGRLCVD